MSGYWLCVLPVSDCMTARKHEQGCCAVRSLFEFAEMRTNRDRCGSKEGSRQ